MARGMKAKDSSAKKGAKTVPAKAAGRTKATGKTKKPVELKLVKSSAPKAKETEAPKAEVSKKVSQKLLETIERRKKEREGAAAGSSNFGRPMRRRGRRPKMPVDYVPTHSENEEESQGAESEYEGLEYDTGIRVKQNDSDRGLSLDRFEDFDEELNFDW